MRVTILIFGLLLIAGSASTVEFKSEPINKAMAENVRYILSGGEFDEMNKNDDNYENISDDSQMKKYSMPKAVLMSAILPGWGEHYVGSREKAKYFFAIEAISWIGYATFKTYGGWREDDMIRYAAKHANAQLEGKDDEFINMVIFYDDIDQFNSLGRVSDPDRPYLLDTPENHWRWQSIAEKDTFRSIHNSIGEADRRANFLLGAVVVNRIVSVVDVILEVRRANNRIENDFSYNEKFHYKFSIDPLNENRLVNFTVSTPF